jgi:hypothetical protein
MHIRIDESTYKADQNLKKIKTSLFLRKKKIIENFLQKQILI